MKAVILAAGFGERMGSLTDHLPKPLIPIINKPILQHLIEALNQSGLKEFIIVVGHQKEKIIAFLKTIPKKGIQLTIIEAEDFEKGPIYSFASCLEKIQNEDFILVPADFIIEPSALLDLLQRSVDQPLILAYDDQNLPSSHTTMHISSHQQPLRVLGISSNVIGGQSEIKSLLPILISRINIHSYIKEGLKLKQKRVIDAVELYVRERKDAFAFKIQKGYWFDIDTIQDALTANTFLMNQHSPNDPSIDSVLSQNILLKKPILIGKNCYIEEKCSIGPNVTIGDNSFVGKNVRIHNAIICASSNVPPNTEINNAIFFKLNLHK